MDAGKAKVGSTNGLFKPPATRLARGIYPYFCMSRRANLAPTRDGLRMSRRDLGRLGEHQQWLAVVGNGRFVDDNA